MVKAVSRPSTEVVRILLLEANRLDADACIQQLRSSGLEVHADVARSHLEFTERISLLHYDLILAAYNLSDWTGLDAFRGLRASGHDAPFILLTGEIADRATMECIKAGIRDYVFKNNLESLPIAIRKILNEQRLRRARDRAEKELRESEKQYRVLFNANPHPMWVFDSVTLRFLTVNQAAIHHYGYSLNEFLSMTVKDIRPAEDVEEFLKSVDPRVDSGETYSALWRHKKKDGTIIDVEISSQPISLRGIQAQLVLARDVTEQLQTKARIRESQQQLQLLLDSTAEAIFAVDGKGICTLCNPACLRLLGYRTESELLGKTVHTVMHHTRANGQSYPPKECTIYRSSHNGERAHVTDEVFWRADGSSFPVEYWSHPIKRSDRIVGSVVTFFDITERRRAEEQLKRSESRYRSIIEGAPYGIYRADQGGCIVMANPALAAMLGYRSPRELLGLNTKKDIYLNPADQQRARQYASENATLGYEVRWKRKDGKTITVRLGGRRMPDDDEYPGGYEVFVEDITEQRSLQKQFEHSQRMEAVGRLAGGVAHDFNNLLMIINSYAQLMEDPKKGKDKRSHYLAQIREASAKAAGITRQLLTFSRREVLEPTILDLNLIVKDLGKMLPRLLGEDIEMVMDLDPQVGTFKADRGQIEQIIMNLVVNARDAMPRGGRLRMETANVTLDTTYHQRRETSVPPGRYVLLAVSDTGVGMDAETQLHIFEPFFSTKDEGEGTGLGLATVYAMVKQSGGFVWVYSEPGKGSTFKIYMPRLDAAATRASGQSLQPAPGGTETVLLAEDDPTLLKVIRVYLESKGYNVLEASNAKEALELCERHPRPIRVLITDMLMPGMGGVELAKSALKFRPQLGVVFVSGYADRRPDIDAASIAATFLPKPFSLDALARCIQVLLSSHRRVLLIDDSKFMRAAIERVLNSAGYLLTTAADGEEGLRMVRERQPDVVLLDMILPKASGFEVLHALKEDPATKKIPVIVLTGLSEKNQGRLLAEGAAALLEKSDKLLDDGTDIIAAITRVLHNA